MSYIKAWYGQYKNTDQYSTTEFLNNAFPDDVY